MTYLLDARVLIALVDPSHEQHPEVAAHMTSVENWALCPVVEGAFVRYVVRMGRPAGEVLQVLDRLHADPRVTLVPDSLSYRELRGLPLLGHRQATDFYLAALARSLDMTLLTLDERLANTLPDLCRLVPWTG